MATDKQVEQARERVRKLEESVEEARAAALQGVLEASNDVTVAQLGVEEETLKSTLAALKTQAKVNAKGGDSAVLVEQIQSGDTTVVADPNVAPTEEEK